MCYCGFMKTILLALALSSVAAYADEASKKIKVEAFFKAAGLEETFSKSMSLVRSQMKSGISQQILGVKSTPEQSKASEEFQEKIGGFITETFSWETLKPGFVEIYLEAFTEKELEDFIAFYNSPSGKAMVAKNPGMMSKASEVAQKRMALAMPKLQEMMKSFMESNMPPKP